MQAKQLMLHFNKRMVQPEIWRRASNILLKNISCLVEEIKFQFYKLGFVFGVEKVFQVLYQPEKYFVKTTTFIARHPKKLCTNRKFWMKGFLNIFKMIIGTV